MRDLHEQKMQSGARQQAQRQKTISRTVAPVQGAGCDRAVQGAAAGKQAILHPACSPLPSVKEGTLW